MSSPTPISQDTPANINKCENSECIRTFFFNFKMNIFFKKFLLGVWSPSIELGMNQAMMNEFLKMKEQINHLTQIVAYLCHELKTKQSNVDAQIQHVVGLQSMVFGNHFDTPVLFIVCFL
ncbi:hypothetical protein RFI_13314 [Reticulomyxa filosa]|uniref:Uncharacterized protein n=1 Tax=Reticulomyxa filosa TaxID=46433 RepID=X6NC37_RETFI|nr:hypothetical protein RFI_13314 [Reticulomyxa filosa]|eukprot:ETO23855.1 hypothetical protein RFI_13314 [Reticulomyxa filosa]